MRGDQVTAPPAHTLPLGNQTPDARRWGGGAGQFRFLAPGPGRVGAPEVTLISCFYKNKKQQCCWRLLGPSP